MRPQIALFLCAVTISLATQLTGSVSSSIGTPTYSTITAIDLSSGQAYTTETFGNSYNLSLPDGSIAFHLSATASNNISISQWSVPGFFPLDFGKSSIASDATLNLTFEPCFTLVLVDYDSNGLKSHDEFPYYVWTTDTQGSASRGTKERILSNAGDTLGLSVPLGTVNYILTQRTVDGAGDVALFATNNGNGYTSTQPGGMVVNITSDLASTYLQKLRTMAQGTNFSMAIESLASGISQSTPMEAATTANGAISQALTIETNMELSRAQQSAGQYRNTNITVKATDETGKAVPGITVQLSQTSSDFKFGVYGGPGVYNATGPWQQLVDAGVNSVTVDFWWSATQPLSGTIDDDYVINQKIGFLKSLGLSLRATGLFQPHPSILPAYVRGLEYDDFSRALYDHVYRVVGKFCTEFDIIEVSTDLNLLASYLGFNQNQTIALQQVSLSAIRAAAPGVKTTVTATNVLPQGDSWTSIASPLAFARQWIATGQTVDQLGLSIYNSATNAPQLTIGGLSDQLDAQAVLARPLAVTRLTPPTTIPFGSQPTFLEQFYQVAYSKKYVKEITWWGLIGPDSTLFDENLIPTPLFYSLKKSIGRLNRPATNVPLNNGGNGATSTPGGTYTVTVLKDGVPVGTSSVHIDEARSTKMSVLYRNADGKAIVLLNPTNGPVVGVAPAPLALVDSGSPAPTTRIPTWGVIIIVLGTVAVVAVVSTIIAFAVVRRSRTPAPFLAETPAHLKPVANVAPKSFDIPFEEEEKQVTPDTWQGQPLSIVIPMDESADDDEQAMEQESETSESSLEDVELDDNEDISSETSESEDEHL